MDKIYFMTNRRTKVKRLAIVFHSFEAGGEQRVFLNIASVFKERGYEVDLVVAVKKGPFLENAQKTGARVVDLGVSKFRYALPKMMEYLRRERPFAVLSGLTHVNLLVIIAKIISKINSRVVISEHGHLNTAIQNSPYWWVRPYPWLIPCLYPFADSIVCVSAGVADDLARLGRLNRDKIRVIYNPIVHPELFEEAERPLEDPWFVDDIPVILGVGRLEKEKDFPTLIRAFAEIRKKRLVRLIILGEGRERAVLETLVKELNIEQDVRLPGFVSNPYAYMRRATLLVLSSIREGFGNVLVEAMALGTPVVATDCPTGPAEILEGGKFGPLVPVGDYQRLAEAINYLLEHPPERDLLRRRAFEFEVKHIALQYLEELDPDFSFEETKIC